MGFPGYLHFGLADHKFYKLHLMSDNFLEQLIELRNLYSGLEFITKDTNEHPDEGTQGKAGEGPECRSLCPRGVGVAILPAHGCIHQPGNSLSPLLSEC